MVQRALLFVALAALAAEVGALASNYRHKRLVAVPSATNLRVEYLSGRPIGIQTRAPAFSWGLRHGTRGICQESFRLTVNSTGFGHARTVWSSGRVTSNRTVGWILGGANVSIALTSDTDYMWGVEVWWSGGDAEPTVAAAASFSTALFAWDKASSFSDWADSSWIGGLDQEDDRNQFRSSFSLPAGQSIERARCFVSGLGYHSSYVNGIKLGGPGEVLGPSVQFQVRLPYDVYDCTHLLRSGGAENVFATTLGRGWYSLPEDGFTAKLGYRTLGKRSLRVLITAIVSDADGERSQWRTGTDGKWRHAAGPIVGDHLFLGEVVDGRRETPGWTDAGFDDSAWSAVAPASVLPNAALEALQIPAIRKVTPFQPVAVKELSAGVYVYDLKQNMAGICSVRVDDTSAASPGKS